MIIPNSPIFNDLIGQNLPNLVSTTYDPTLNWARPELLALPAGSLVIHVGSGGCAGGCTDVCLYLKTKQTATTACPPLINGSGDYRRCCCTIALSGVLAPDGDDPSLCTAPIGTFYARNAIDGTFVQGYVKVKNNCNDADWQPITITLTQNPGSTSFNPVTQVLNIQPGGTLSDGLVNPDGTHEYTWTPDNGGTPFTFIIPAPELPYTLTYNLDPVNYDLTLVGRNFNWPPAAYARRVANVTQHISPNVFTQLTPLPLVDSDSTAGVMAPALETDELIAPVRGRYDIDVHIGATTDLLAGEYYYCRATINGVVAGGGSMVSGPLVAGPLNFGSHCRIAVQQLQAGDRVGVCAITNIPAGLDITASNIALELIRKT